jgi:hypothetical protein
MGKADYYADGQWNFFCDLCGAKVKSSNGVKTWANSYVCRHHKEVRNPQDFLRGVKDDQSVAWSRPEAADTFVTIPWTRWFEDNALTTEAISNNFGKTISTAMVGSGLNGVVLNTFPLNSTAVSGVPQESVAIIEGISLLNLKVAADSVAIADLKYFGILKVFSEPLQISESIYDSVNEVHYESSLMSESYQSWTAKAFADPTGIAESVAFSISSGAVLNGAAINSLNLG